jgi:hypothetical protein
MLTQRRADGGGGVWEPDRSANPPPMHLRPARIEQRKERGVKGAYLLYH